MIALLGTGLKAISGYGAGYAPGPRTFGTPAYIGKLLLTRFLLAFEIASFLLLIAAVGAVVLARRRGGLGEADEREDRSRRSTCSARGAPARWPRAAASAGRPGAPGRASELRDASRDRRWATA